MYCRYCGSELEEGAKFCGKCGRSLDGSSQAETETETEVQPETQPETEPQTSPEKPTQLSKKTVAIGAAVLLALVGLLLGKAFNLFGTSGYDVEFKIAAEGLDEGGTRVPIRAAGTLKEGKSYEETFYVAPASAVVRLPQGEYSLEVLGSPISAEGAIYKIPEIAYKVSVQGDGDIAWLPVEDATEDVSSVDTAEAAEDTQDTQSDTPEPTSEESTGAAVQATGSGSSTSSYTPTFELIEIPPDEVTDEQIAAALELAEGDPSSHVDAKKLAQTAGARRDEAVAELEKWTFEGDGYKLVLPEYWRDRVAINANPQENYYRDINAHAEIYSSNFPDIFLVFFGKPSASFYQKLSSRGGTLGFGPAETIALDNGNTLILYPNEAGSTFGLLKSPFGEDVAFFAHAFAGMRREGCDVTAPEESDFYELATFGRISEDPYADVISNEASDFYYSVSKACVQGVASCITFDSENWDEETKAEAAHKHSEIEAAIANARARGLQVLSGTVQVMGGKEFIDWVHSNNAPEAANIGSWNQLYPELQQRLLNTKYIVFMIDDGGTTVEKIDDPFEASPSTSNAYMSLFGLGVEDPEPDYTSGTEWAKYDGQHITIACGPIRPSLDAHAISFPTTIELISVD